MTASVVGGPISWSLDRDDEGHRTYTIAHRVKTTNALDGPGTVLLGFGVPQIGDIWAFGSETDPWAFCLPQVKVKHDQQVTGDPHRWWSVENRFSTRPINRCQDASIDDPLLEPDRISGSFVKYTEESPRDKDGLLLKSSSWEVFSGPLVEWDLNRPSVIIEQNRAVLQLELMSELVNNLNDRTLWGLAARKVKLSSISWQRKYYGTCGVYYTRRFEFDINFDTFDREIPDQGSKCLRGSWNGAGTSWDLIGSPDKDNPLDFQRFVDRDGNMMNTLLNKAGEPLVNVGTAPAEALMFKVQKYGEVNFWKLGIPSTLA